MTDLTLTMKYRPNQRVDMSPITCDKLAGLELAEIAAIELQNGKRKLRVDELFSISGSDVGKIHINNSFYKLAQLIKNIVSLVYIKGACKS